MNLLLLISLFVLSATAGAGDVHLLAADGNAAPEEMDWDDDDFDFEDDTISDVPAPDPLAPWNRAMFHFNDRVYYWVLKPLAQGYKKIAPAPVRRGVKNIFHNLAAPIRFVSCILQGKGSAAGGEFAGFIANSTFGVFGIFDLTRSHPQLNPKEEDLGQVLGAWGFGNGFYIVWPFLGPSSLRDSLGQVGDRLLNPTTYMESAVLSTGVAGFEMINATSFRIGDYESIKEAAIEPYEAFRNAYLQMREKKVAE
ncbi:MAG: VacJ family lipoprotein [Desulfobacterales bacterium]